MLLKKHQKSAINISLYLYRNLKFKKNTLLKHNVFEMIHLNYIYKLLFSIMTICKQHWNYWNLFSIISFWSNILIKSNTHTDKVYLNVKLTQKDLHSQILNLYTIIHYSEKYHFICEKKIIKSIPCISIISINKKISRLCKCWKKDNWQLLLANYVFKVKIIDIWLHIP